MTAAMSLHDRLDAVCLCLVSPQSRFVIRHFKLSHYPHNLQFDRTVISRYNNR